MTDVDSPGHLPNPAARLAPPAVLLSPLEQEVARLRNATRGAFVAVTSARRRNPHSVGISSVGRCRREVAYALSKTPISDEPVAEEARQANLGTWEHEGLLPWLAGQLPGSTVEHKVRVKGGGLDLPGSIDLNIPITVFDLKTVGEWRLTGVRRVMAAAYHHRVQVGGYALGRLQQGDPPRFVAWLYLDRASGQFEIIVEEFTNALALEVIDRLTELARWAESPDEAPRDERGPGLSIVCDGCYWLRQCWGDDAVPGRTGAQWARNDPDIQQAIADYDAARVREKQAKDDKDYAKARLERARYGDYGPWKYFRRRDTEEDDPWAAARLWRKVLALAEAGDTKAILELAAKEGMPRRSKKGAIVVQLAAPAEGNQA